MREEKIIRLTVTEMTEEVMEELESQGLIVRLGPCRHDLPTPEGETLSQSLYEPSEEYGPHKIITVTVNREGFSGFATHPDREEFWLTGDPNTDPMYIVIARCRRSELEEKIATGNLEKSDFVMLRARYNDPTVSFFIMNPDIPHGEGIVRNGKGAPSFYVTESRDLPLDLIEMGGYCLEPETHEDRR